MQIRLRELKSVLTSYDWFLHYTSSIYKLKSEFIQIYSLEIYLLKSVYQVYNVSFSSYTIIAHYAKSTNYFPVDPKPPAPREVVDISVSLCKKTRILQREG